MTEYYTDEEIIKMIQEELINSVASDKITNLVRERFAQKDNQLSFQAKRLRLAAEHIGFNLIDELETYE